MPNPASQVIELLENYFGDVAGFLFNREMESLGYKSIRGLSETERLRLCDSLLKDVFASVLSPTKIRIIRSKLYSFLEINEKKKEEEDYGYR